MSEPDTLGDALPREIKRVREAAVALMRADLYVADKALEDGDVVAMLHVYQSLKEWTRLVHAVCAQCPKCLVGLVGLRVRRYRMGREGSLCWTFTPQRLCKVHSVLHGSRLPCDRATIDGVPVSPAPDGGFVAPRDWRPLAAGETLRLYFSEPNQHMQVDVEVME